MTLRWPLGSQPCSRLYFQLCLCSGLCCLCFFPVFPCSSHKATPPALAGFSPSRTILQGRQRGEALPNPPSSSWDDPPAAHPEEEQPLPLCTAAPLSAPSEAPGENTRAANPTVRHSALILIVKNSLMRADWYYIAALIKEGYGTAF